jgi:hypothetical protein
MAKISSYMLEYYAYQVIQIKFLLAPKFEISESYFLLCCKIWDVTRAPGLRSRLDLSPAGVPFSQDSYDGIVEEVADRVLLCK